jgi:hypothetical protein
MPQTQTSCPRCRQPVVAQVEQLFDLNVDPKAKQRLLGGGVNVVHCQACGYEGMLGTPIVYHDPEKELLLTFFPPEMGLVVNEQERILGPMLTQVMNKLPPEKRKAYLLRPQSMFTYQTLIEKVLEGDGITKEMIEAQQKRLNLLQRLLGMSPDVRAGVIKQEEKLIDQDFFALLSRLAQATLAQGDEQTARLLAALQKDLVEKTAIGQELQSQMKESEEAVKTLQEAAKGGLTREILLELVINAGSEIKLNTYVSLARQGMDYTFFQLLSDRIDQSSAEEKQRLLALRTSLYDMTQEIDKAMQQQIEAARKVLDEIAAAADVEKAIMEHAQRINEVFVEVLTSELQSARGRGDLERSSKLRKIEETLQKLSSPPPEVTFLEELLAADNEAEIQKRIDANAVKITPEFMQVLNSFMGQAEGGGKQQSPEFIERLKQVYRLALRHTMQANLKK